MSEIIVTPIGSIDPNPFRLLSEYPYVERKIESLMRSFKDVGMWEGVIARKAGNRSQIAFGHHRIEAARRLKLKQVSLVVRDLTDEQMIQFMGRENLEDYNTDFLCMLETWEAAVKFLVRDRENLQPIHIARLLGWTRVDGEEKLNATARACSAAHALIKGGYLSRDDLRELSVKAAQEIVERAQSRMEQIDKMAKITQRPPSETERAKQHIGKAARVVAKGYRQGTHGLGIKDLRGRVDSEAFKSSSKSKKQSPLFAVFSGAVIDSIQKMLRTDATSDKLEQIVGSLSEITMDEDHAAVRRIDFALAEHGILTDGWRKKLAPKGKVIPFNLLKKEA